MGKRRSATEFGHVGCTKHAIVRGWSRDILGDRETIIYVFRKEARNADFFYLAGSHGTYRLVGRVATFVFQVTGKNVLIITTYPSPPMGKLHISTVREKTAQDRYHKRRRYKREAEKKTREADRWQ